MALEIMSSETKYSVEERRFTVPLLFKLPPETSLDNHYPVAYKVAIKSRNKAIKDGMVQLADQAMQSLLDIINIRNVGHARKPAKYGL